MSLLLALADAASATTPAPASGGGGDGFPWGPVVGGVVGALLTILVRSLDVGTEVRRNDVAVAELDQALADWAADRGLRLSEESKPLHAAAGAADGSLASALELYPGMRGVRDARIKGDKARADYALATLRSQALGDYRDRERETRLEVAKIRAGEQWFHRTYRRVARVPSRELATPDAVQPLLASWRKPLTYGVKLTVPDDPTRRTLADVIAAQPVTGP